MGGVGEGSAGGNATPQSMSVITSKSQPKSLLECFIKIVPCAVKVAPENQPRRISAPPSELFFKNRVRALWADKHSPRSLSNFQCHTRQTDQLKQLISYGNCPHLLLQGPSGTGKKALATALLHDIFGDIKVLPEHRPFKVEGGSHATINVPIVTSRYHVEVNILHTGEFDKDVLRSIFKELNLSSDKSFQSPRISSQSEHDFKLILVLNGDKLSVEAQQILRRNMDRYGDTCKLVLCCNSKDATSTEPILSDAIRSRCQIINLDVPSQEEMEKVLAQVATKEGITLPKAFATKIAEHCKDSLRKAIVQLEACKTYQYPFKLDQPVPVSHWEEDVIQIVADIVEDPTPHRLFAVRKTMLALLTDCVSPILILQKLLEEFLLRTDAHVKNQICHSAGFYETRLRSGPNPIDQLQAFLAKVLSIYKSTQPVPKPRLGVFGSPRISLDRYEGLEISVNKPRSDSSPLK